MNQSGGATPFENGRDQCRRSVIAVVIPLIRSQHRDTQLAVFAFLFLALYLAVVAGIGYLIFSPFAEVAALKPTHAKTFQLTDLLAFFFPFQFGFAAINLIFPDITWNYSSALSVTVGLLVISGLAWTYGMRLLWRMDATTWFKRVVLLGLIMPFGIVIAGTTFPILISANSVLSFFVRVVVLALLVWSLRYIVSWVLSELETPIGNHNAG